jgi:hypothetical protein
MEFTQLTGLSAVGPGTLEHLESVVSDLNRVYSKDPPAEQFVVARAYRSRADELIRGHRMLKEMQSLYVYAAWLSELLAWLAHDLGNSRTAQAYALDCWLSSGRYTHRKKKNWACSPYRLNGHKKYPTPARGIVRGAEAWPPGTQAEALNA